MPKIEPLSASVVNKIAAGEVVERPASVVKELLENAIDSGATRIDVEIEQGGCELVRVVDDGCGIAADELTLAVSSHATSKIRSAEDLFRVGTLGFRGEALASIAEVSRLRLRSRAETSDAAAEIEVVGGQASPVTPSAAPRGTVVEVRNLFFNTPVRRKFLRSAQTEMGHATEAFVRLALAQRAVHFALRHNGRLVHEVPPSANWAERIGQFFGREVADQLIWVESHDDAVRLTGYVAHPSQNRGSARMQYLFLNGRVIRDRSLQHALLEAYRGLLLSGRYPICFLRFDMPPELVDVNVHPTKLEVRFQDGSRLYSQLLGTLRTKFLTTDLNNRLDTAAAKASVAAECTDGNGGTANEDALRRQLVDWVAQQSDVAGAKDDASERPSLEDRDVFERDAGEARAPLELNRVPRRWENLKPAAPPPRLVQAPPRIAPGEATAAPLPMTERPIPALQVHDRYLIAESDEGVVVIDQHALHERILYEELRQQVLAGPLERQCLLVPAPVDLAAEEAAAVLEHREDLERLGMTVEPFGGDTVLVSSYPAIMAKHDPAELLRTLVEVLVSKARSPEPRDLVDDVLHMVACKAAIKAGDRLSPEEVIALVQKRHLVQDTHHCPHGRPTALVLTREELDKQFLRT